jgi:hypothetical protein
MAKSKLPAAPARLSLLAAKVFAETAFFTGAGMEKGMAGRDFFLDDKARDFWLIKHARTITRALKNPGADWEQDRTVVLPRALDLGKFAAEFALADGSSEPVEVKRKHVVAASKKVSKDRRCKAAMKKTGRGAYCQ